VHELRGRYYPITLQLHESIELVTLAASIAEENSVLQLLIDDYVVAKETRKKGQKNYKHFYEFLMSVLMSETKTSQLQLKVIIYIIYYY
jgi:hypothetical protein